MVSVRNILFFAATAACSVLPRQLAVIQADLQTINSDTTKLTSLVNAFQGGVANSIPVQNAEQQLESDITKATTDANNSPAQNSTNSQTIIAYITNTLEPNIKAAITAIDNKKAVFVSSSLQGLVQNDLANLKTKTTALGNALIAKSSSDQTANAQAILNKVIADIQVGIDYYA